MAKNRNGYKVAVVGATGAVGREMIRMLEIRSFPVSELRLFASERSKDQKLKFKNSEINVEVLNNQYNERFDIALFSAGSEISRIYAPLFSQNGTFVIDNSSQWRMDPTIPLIVPEVNDDSLLKEKKIIANPNCSTIQMVVVLNPIMKTAGINTIRVATYQSVSGAGWKGIQDLNDQTRSWANGTPMPAPKKIPHQIAFNCVPQVDVFLENSYTKEEMKMVNETRKILNSPDIRISATCVRVPVFRSHSEAVWIETKKFIGIEDVRKLLSNSPGIKVIDNPAKGEYPMPIMAEGSDITYVGRIRQDLCDTNGLLFWIVSDNLLKGAALNAVQIAEVLIKKSIL